MCIKFDFFKRFRLLKLIVFEKANLFATNRIFPKSK